MKVDLLDPKTIKPTATDLDRGSYLELLRFAQISTGHHSCVENIEDADFVIACISSGGYGPFLKDLKRHNIYKKHKNRIFVYSMDDNQYPAIPGIYPALEISFYNQGWAMGGHYFSSFISKHEFKVLPFSHCDILFSFIGSSKNHQIRSEILQLNSHRAILQDSSCASLKNWWDNTDEEKARILENFRDKTSRSKFCLCPRGISASSIRLFEAMQAGAVPVIIADDLVLPDGPDWKSFSVMLKESDVSAIPAILESIEANSESMGRLARAAWENYFSPESSFETIVSYISNLNTHLLERGNWSQYFLELKVAFGEMSVVNLRTKLRLLYYGLKTKLSN
jgi:hypothetical protein